MGKIPRVLEFYYFVKFFCTDESPDLENKKNTLIMPYPVCQSRPIVYSSIPHHWNIPEGNKWPAEYITVIIQQHPATSDVNSLFSPPNYPYS